MLNQKDHTGPNSVIIEIFPKIRWQNGISSRLSYPFLVNKSLMILLCIPKSVYALLQTGLNEGLKSYS